MKRKPTPKPFNFRAFILVATLTGPLWLVMALFFYCFLMAIFTGGYAR